MKTTKQVLIDARKLLTEKGWTQHVFASNVHGDEVPATSAAATRFCSLGAVAAAAGWAADHDLAHNKPHECAAFGEAEKQLNKALALAFETAPNDVISFNDDHATLDDVLTLFDRAIAIAPDEVAPLPYWLSDDDQVVS